MKDAVEHQIGALGLLCLPNVSSTGWDPATAKAGLHQLRRLQGEIDAWRAVLIGVLKTETGRDTKAVLARGFGMSGAEAKKAEQVADVVSRVAGAGDALANGDVTGEHLRVLAPIADADEAAELLALAPSQSPEDFAKTVEKYRIECDSKGWRHRQQRARSVRFFKADYGCVGMRVILPTLDGESVKASLNETCDAAWREAHPERAESLGGHDDEPRECRLADALVGAITGQAGGSARTALIVTVQAETLDANILGVGPIPTEEALGLVDDPRTDIYAAIQVAGGAMMKFGRSRRLASPLQKLALAVRDGGMCTRPGCSVPWNRCDADHVVSWDDGGLTDLENLRYLCTSDCHRHRHETATTATRQPHGTWTVDGEHFPAWPIARSPAPNVDFQPRSRLGVVGRPISDRSESPSESRPSFLDN